MPNTKNDQKIQVTPNQKALLVQTVKQLITLNQKKPTANTTQEQINQTINKLSNRFHDMFEIVEQ
ncbi:hypothetical protein AKG60_03370 [Vibrio parahaemolyticus]|uniref:Uncharacterized protein n=2 Tax=Vibrio TaxID=662 RepID=A0AAX0MGT2_VIBPH|nr:hypothetical protein [Vibrio parahaemolyticus]AXX63096.1 hypothetical protein FORC53_4757 [Vibrio vulnificus]MDW2154788.1 hypothetical protein [Vibrio sp. 2092]EGR2217316.1 hypothetical protein [Vibrio parahaemolyticus]EGR3309521.1 hypothetical protein [Vibrio parahaemolyticus]KOF25521.1 hypothetical protein ACX13_22250 [Vibrio parahaemolyticus]